MMTIKCAAELTGVPEHTLRAWERRYSAFAPTRTPGGYRVYDEEALRRIRAMRDLVRSGASPREAARDAGLPAQLQPAQLQPAAESHERVLEALTRLDAAATLQLIDEQFALRSYESLVDDWLLPLLQRVGEAWAAGRITVAGEHLLSQVVTRRLAAAFDAAGPRPTTQPVIVGAPSGITHELGLMAFAVALRRAGVPTTYLGGDVPVDAWSQAVGTTGSRLSVTTIPRRQDAGRVAKLAAALAADHPGTTLAVGGRYQDRAPAGCLALGHRITEATRLVVGRHD